MATQEASPTAPPPSAQAVGHAFVAQYYHILQQSPEYVYKFYQDISSLSRPDSNGVMTSVTTMQAINDKIMSFGYENLKAEIETADALESYKEGVIVLVTGRLTGKDDLRRKFAQTFFLAPQEKGYFVLNDVLRYVDSIPSEVKSVSVNNVASVSVNNVAQDTHVALPPSDPEPILGSDHLGSDHPREPAGTFEGEVLNNNSAEVYDPSDHEDGSVLDGVVINETPTHANPVEEANTLPTPDSVDPLEKKSYASIVKVTKVARATAPIYVATNKTKLVPATSNQPLPVTTKPSPNLEASQPAGDIVPESATTNQEVAGYSVYVRNLPLSASIEQLEEEFKKFGSIKHDGVQVRSNKQQGYCFGFVEFESSDSMLAAIQASPVTIGDHKSVVEEKRTTRGGGSGLGKYSSSGRGGLRGDNFRGRGNNFSRNRGGYTRHEFSGRGRGGGEGYRRVDQRAGHEGGGTNQTSGSGERA